MTSYRKKPSQSKKFILLVSLFILAVALIFIAKSKGPIETSNIRWSCRGQTCEITFDVINTSERVVDATFILEAFDKVHRGYQSLGRKEIILTIDPQKKISVHERLNVMPTFKSTKVQVRIGKVDVK